MCVYVSLFTVLNSVSQKELLRSLKFCSKLSLSVPGGDGGEKKKKERTFSPATWSLAEYNDSNASPDRCLIQRS